MTPEFDNLISELEAAAAALRSGDMNAEQAANAVERCAELAGRVGAELDRAAREADRDAADGDQAQLL